MHRISQGGCCNIGRLEVPTWQMWLISMSAIGIVKIEQEELTRLKPGNANKAGESHNMENDFACRLKSSWNLDKFSVCR